MRLRKFMVIVSELFFILLIYKMWEGLTKLPLGLYLLFAIIVLAYLNYWLAKWELMGDIGRTIMYKLVARMTFTKDWFGILTMFFVVFGFFISYTMLQSAFMAYLIIILGIVCAYYLLHNSSGRMQENGLLLIGFLIGVGIGSRYASSWFIILVFALGNIVIFFTSYPGEKEK